MEKRGTGRRTLLQRGLALLAGGVAVAAGTRSVRADAAVAAPVEPTVANGPRTLTLYARKRPVAEVRRGTRAAQTSDSRTLTSGELLDAPNGSAVGWIHTNCFCTGTPLGPHKHAASNLEFHVLELEDGTLFGIGGGASASGARAHAIVGGTGRYAAARGSYIERPMTGRGTRYVVELVVTLAV